MKKATLLHTRELRSEEALTHEGETVLFRISALPQLQGADRRVLERINRFYQRLETADKRACHTWLLARAAGRAEAAHAAALPFSPLRVSLTWETVLLSDSLWSLVWHWSVQEEETVLFSRRQGEVWDLDTGLPCALERFVPKKTHRKHLLRLLRKAAREQGWRRPGRRGQRLSFTVTEEALTFYWPPSRDGAPGEKRYLTLDLPEGPGMFK